MSGEPAFWDHVLESVERLVGAISWNWSATAMVAVISFGLAGGTIGILLMLTHCCLSAVDKMAPEHPFQHAGAVLQQKPWGGLSLLLCVFLYLLKAREIVPVLEELRNWILPLPQLGFLCAPLLGLVCARWFPRPANAQKRPRDCWREPPSSVVWATTTAIVWISAFVLNN